MSIDLSKDAVHRVIFSYAIPTIVAMLAMSAAGIVDGIVVGQFIHTDAIAAINLVWPLSALIRGLGLMINAGGITLSGTASGENNPKEACNIFSVTMIMIIVLSAILMLVMLLFTDQIVSTLGANASALILVKEYATPLIWFFPVFMLTMVLEGFVRMDGRPAFAMNCLVAGVLLNVILSPIFVGGCRWGLHGAALATGLSQALSFILLSTHFITKKGLLRLIKPRFRMQIIAGITGNGFSEFANALSGGITAMLFNIVLMRELGLDGVSAFSIVGYIVMIASVFFIAIGSAISPAVSYNFGAKQASRISKFLTQGLLLNIATGIIILTFLLIGADIFTALFTRGNSTLTQWTGNIARMYSPALVLSGINILISMYFTALQRALKSAAIAIAGALVFKIAFLYILPHYWGELGIWLSVPFAELCTFILAIFLLRFDGSLKKIRNNAITCRIQ